MFARRYFPGRYWAARFFASGGATSIGPAPAVRTLVLGPETRVLGPLYVLYGRGY